MLEPRRDERRSQQGVDVARAPAVAAKATAGIWASINGVNLRENVAPTRLHAHLILRRGADHSVEPVQLRRL